MNMSITKPDISNLKGCIEDAKKVTPTNLLIIGDLIREIVAREVALKIAETSYLSIEVLVSRSFCMDPITLS
jgi:glucosamine 6-phosphate synthetase-like amidotransferase/phosphosugar isomerase protein